MLTKLFTASIVFFTVISIAFAGSVPNMQEGKWEITTKMEMPGMPMNMPPTIHTQCLTKKDIVPHSSQPGQKCKITQTNVTGNTVTWTMECSDQSGGMKGTGEVTYKGDSLKGTIKMTMVQSNMEMTMYIKGHRIGDCN